MNSLVFSNDELSFASSTTQIIVDTKKQGNEVVVVVSAMGDTTDELIELAEQVSPKPAARELDMLLTAGERISMAVLAMAIHDLGMEARSYTGSQAGLITDATRLTLAASATDEPPYFCTIRDKKTYLLM